MGISNEICNAIFHDTESTYSGTYNDTHHGNIDSFVVVVGGLFFIWDLEREGRYLPTQNVPEIRGTPASGR